MVMCKGSMVVISLLMALVVGGCAAAQSASNDASANAANAAYDNAAMHTRQIDPAGGATANTQARPRLSEFVTHERLRDVHFDFDSYQIAPAETKALDQSLQWLRANPDALVVIEGHADERGTGEYNVALGERRAKASMNYLIARGVPASRITLMSYGEERGVCRDHNESCWSKNRRAHFLVKAR